MSLVTALLSTEPPRPKRGRGRPPVAEDPAQRSLHNTVAKARILFGRPVDELAAAFDVSDRTVRNWTRLALSYPGPLGDALRRAHGASRN